MDERNAAGQFGAMDQGDRHAAGFQRSRHSYLSCLAELAGCITLAFGMDVSRSYNDEKDGNNAQRERQNASRVPIERSFVGQLTHSRSP